MRSASCVCRVHHMFEKCTMCIRSTPCVWEVQPVHDKCTCMRSALHVNASNYVICTTCTTRTPPRASCHVQEVNQIVFEKCIKRMGNTHQCNGLIMSLSDSGCYQEVLCAGVVWVSWFSFTISSPALTCCHQLLPRFFMFYPPGLEYWSLCYPKLDLTSWFSGKDPVVTLPVL